MYDWHLDLTPPREGDVERSLTFGQALSNLSRGFGQAGLIISGKLLKAFNAFDDVFILGSKPISGHRPILSASKPKTPFKHDRPTNLLYPTSLDSWFNEYNQPLRNPQVHSIRIPYRR